ncbi:MULTISPECIES: hypothetical protein [Sphingomonas]|uniref:hypothetical protein n=1 Tax=Sphingomonas TaxID=13687 RepID=UPI001269EDED|nr:MULTISPECIES: hypothetical protein [Sphingomonas]
MLLLFVLATAQSSQATILVGGFDNRPTLTVAEGYGTNLAPIKAVAETCGFTQAWLWDDDSAEAQLWVLAAEASRKRKSCLDSWRSKHSTVPLTWKLHQSH